MAPWREVIHHLGRHRRSCLPRNQVGEISRERSPRLIHHPDVVVSSSEALLRFRPSNVTLDSTKPNYLGLRATSGTTDRTACSSLHWEEGSSRILEEPSRQRPSDSSVRSDGWKLSGNYCLLEASSYFTFSSLTSIYVYTKQALLC